LPQAQKEQTLEAQVNGAYVALVRILDLKVRADALIGKNASSAAKTTFSFEASPWKKKENEKSL